jgi:2-oxoglutarate ferredoxin oxidoreductase subunit delta
MTTLPTSIGHVLIDIEQCKGCDLCIPVCPPRVLEMTVTDVNAMGYRFPLLHDGCTGCGRCHAVCPDFVFTVFKEPT